MNLRFRQFLAPRPRMAVGQFRIRHDGNTTLRSCPAVAGTSTNVTPPR
jgi:hypothetical protein